MPNQAATRRNCERKVRTLFVTKEMFVIRLDRPWQDTPFWLQGFKISTDEELKAINKYCDFVYIDIARGKKAKYYMEENLDLPSNCYLEEFLIDKKKKKKQTKYRVQTSLKQELISAKKILQEITTKYVLMMQAVKKGEELSVRAINSLIKPMLESIIRNPDAFVLLTRLRKKKEYTFSHEIDACALSILFGRHMGLSIENLKILSVGVLLFDIGKLRIDDSVLNKTEQLTDEEFKQVNRHVDYGIDILKNVNGIIPDILNIVLTHHERFDGSGYPNGLPGLKIPVYGRMAAIIDCYDAMTSQRSFAPSTDPAKALQLISGWKNSLFQAELVEEFLRCMGVYPNGSFVELKSGEVAIVIAQTPMLKLTPRVLLVLDRHKQAYKTTDIVDLSKENLTDSGKTMSIMKEVSPLEIGVNTEVIFEKISSIIPEEAVPEVRMSEKIGDMMGKMF